MTAKIQLWLKNYLFQETEFEVPDFDHLPTFESRCEMKERYLKLKAQEMAAIYHPQIDNCGGAYKIFLIVQSKMNLVEEIA